jgi:hypothetical protein
MTWICAEWVQMPWEWRHWPRSSPLKIAGAKMAVTMESCPSVGGPLPPEGSNGLDNALFDGHTLTVNKLRKDNQRVRSLCCYMCSILGTEVTGQKTSSTNHGCFKCGYAYHPTCFNLQHVWSLNSDTTNQCLDSQIAKARNYIRNEYISNPTEAQIKIKLGN